MGRDLGMSLFHASVGGLGGCPYAKGATGNVATEDLLYLLDGLGIETGVDLDAIVSIGDWVSQQMGRDNSVRAAFKMARRVSCARCCSARFSSTGRCAPICRSTESVRDAMCGYFATG
jgi:hypothetical protein